MGLVDWSADLAGGLLHANLPVADDLPVVVTMGQGAGVRFETTPNVVQAFLRFLAKWELALEKID